MRRVSLVAGLFATAAAAAAAVPEPVLARQAAGQDAADTVRLRDIVVTATRLPTARDAVPAAVTVITGEELRARGVRLVGDALRTVPGASFVQSGSNGGIASLFMRGGESDYVLVLVDGVQVNEPGGAFDFAHLPVHNVERVEVVRGPASVLYGTDAVAGVIQIFTREGSGPPRITVNAERGRGAHLATPGDAMAASGHHGTRALDAAVTGRTGSLRYSFGAAQFRTDGVLPVNNAYDNRSLSARLAWSAPDDNVAAAGAARSDVAVSARWADNEYHYPTDGAGRVVNPYQFTTGRSLVLGLDAGHRVIPAFETRVLIGLHRTETGFDDRPTGPADTLDYFAESANEGTRGSADLRANVTLARATVFTLGAAAAAQDGSTRYHSNSQWGPYSNATDNERSSRALYAQVVTSPVTRLTVTLGGRAEDNREFGRFDTWRVGANWRLTAGTTLRAAAGTAFKEPTFYENYATGGVTGNPALLPERSRNREVGVSQALGAGARVEVTWFSQRFRDMIQYDARPREQRPGDANYYNLAEATASGVEAEFTARLHTRARVSTGATWLETEVTDAGLGAERALLLGERLVRRPALTAHAGLHGQPADRLSGALTLRHVGERADLDFATAWQGERVVLPAFTTLDVAARFDLLGAEAARDLALTVRAENILDARYQEIRGYHARGRTLFVGVSAGVGGR